MSPPLCLTEKNFIPKERVKQNKPAHLSTAFNLFASGETDGKSILFPEQKQFAPKQQALKWREQRLKAG